MSYIEDNLMTGERVIYQATVHWIVFVHPILVLLVGITSKRMIGSILSIVGTILIITAFVYAVRAVVYKATAEFGVTNKRVLVKVGFIRRHSLETLLEKVEGIGVDQNIGGRIFGYGTISVTGTGGTREKFANISAPLEFRKEVQQQIEALRTSR